MIPNKDKTFKENTPVGKPSTPYMIDKKQTNHIKRRSMDVTKG